MEKMLYIIGGLLTLYGWIRIQRLAKPEDIQENVYKIVDNYKDEDVISDEDWEKCMDHIKKPLHGISASLKIVIMGSSIVVLGAVIQIIGICL